MISRGRYKRGYGKTYRSKYEGVYQRINRVNLYKHRYYRKTPIRSDGLISLIGIIIVIIGILIIFKNTMIYSGGGVSRGFVSGTPCGLAFILLMVGLIITLCKKNSFVGWALVSIGLIWFFIGIIMNFKMVFMPMNLLKVIMLFGIIAVGVSIIIRGLCGNRRG